MFTAEQQQEIAEQQQEIINNRHEIVLAYCKEKGWDANPATMTMEQIMEIRSQQNWKEVPQKVAEGGG